MRSRYQRKSAAWCQYDAVTGLRGEPKSRARVATDRSRRLPIAASEKRRTGEAGENGDESGGEKNECVRLAIRSEP